MVDRMKFYFESQQDRLFDGLLGQAWWVILNKERNKWINM
jgi:hypothetical protein